MRGVLYAPTGGLLLKATGKAPASDPGAVVLGKAYALRRAGRSVWERCDTPHHAPDPALNAMGYTHYVTLVRTADSAARAEVAVDWSLGQFSYIPSDILLFLAD